MSVDAFPDEASARAAAAERTAATGKVHLASHGGEAWLVIGTTLPAPKMRVVAQQGESTEPQADPRPAGVQNVPPYGAGF